ncbi:hypothetical protein [Spiroplasma endosymbiont of Asaphidion curtum]|uniref:hypothetical protein n=1 Tax=Spiroplasma endosymbiont of Asaphidion curtum TaxID=3066281 RepID=UPI00313E7D3C
MRNILKCFITMLLTAVPVLSIVACSKNNGDGNSSFEHSEENVIDPIVRAKNLIDTEVNKNYREKIFTANVLRISDSDIKNTMIPLVERAQTEVVVLENKKEICQNILRILQNDLIASLNKKLKTEMVYFANINTPASFTNEKARFNVTEVSFDQMVKVLGDLKNSNSRVEHLVSESSNSNDYYVYKLKLEIELDLLLKQGQAAHNIYLDIYLTQDKDTFVNKRAELTELVKNHISNNITFNLEWLEFQALNKKNIQNQILKQINGNTKGKLNISNGLLKTNLLINSLNSKTKPEEYLEFLKVSDNGEMSDKIKRFIIEDANFKINNPNFREMPDSKEILLGNFTFTFWNATYFQLPLQRIALENMKIKVTKGAFETQLLNIAEVMMYYFLNVFCEKKTYRGPNKNSLYLIIPKEVWRTYVNLTGDSRQNKVFNVGTKFQGIFNSAIVNHNEQLLQKKKFKGFKSLTDKILITVTGNKMGSIGSWDSHSGLKGVNVELKFGFFSLNLLQDANFWYGLAIE